MNGDASGRNGMLRRHGDNSEFDPKSVAGQISVKDMGSRVAEPLATNANTRAINRDPSGATGEALGGIGSSAGSNSAYYGDANLEKISYRPRLLENQTHFENLTTQVRDYIPDESHSVILSAADAILEVLRSLETSIQEKRASVDRLLSTKLNDTQMAELVRLANSITDYGSQAEDEVLDGSNGVTGIDGAIAVDFEDDNEVDNNPTSLDPKATDQSEPLMVQEMFSAEQKRSPDDVQAVLHENIEDSGAVVYAETESHDTEKPLKLADIKRDVLFNRISALEPDKTREDIIETCKAVSKVLSNKELGSEEVESRLMELLQFQHLQFVKFCVQNRNTIVYGLKLLHNRENAVEEMKQAGLTSLLAELGVAHKKRALSEDEQGGHKRSKISKDDGPVAPDGTPVEREPKIVDLDGLVFDQGPQLMASARIVLPKGSYQQNKKLYDTITVPAPSSPPTIEETGERLVSINEMPEWAQVAFPAGEMSTLNRIQSKVYPKAFESDDNLLICAPTGAGKTNVAILALLRVLNNHRNAESGKLELDSFKAVYVAPLKALVSEQTRELTRRLSSQFGILVSEFTGDSSLSQREIAETQILVTTPEKWDVATRKATEDSFTKQVKLLIVDEVHLLHDDRGPVLESIIVRAKRNLDTRIVALSATLPNYHDVAQFLNVDLTSSLFYFDASYRPCPLEQEFIGIKEKKAILKVAAMNEACFDKVVECRKNGHQVIIFVHSRKDTVKTAKWLADKVAHVDGVSMISSTGTQEVLKQESENAHNRNLAEVLPTGFAIHHAGLDKEDRAVVEALFAQGHVPVLVSTATLAWGVNLPAHTVIIKGTETYNPEKGTWIQLSPQDILQMLGRAGRPRYDISGEGVIITAHEELQYYLAILNQQLPIESQFMSRLADNLNAEVVLGQVRSRADAVEWLAQTYLYIRMLRAPRLYQVGPEYEGDTALVWKRNDLAHSALTLLHQDRLVIYDAASGKVSHTELGKIAAHFYIGHESIALYNASLKPWMTEIDILRVFTMSSEFKYIPVRQEERLEVSKLADRCPVPIKEPPGDPHAKVNVLLQSYISRLRLEGFALMADMIYITQSAGRLLRAIHEICVKNRWAGLALCSLELCKHIERRIWSTNSPFRQFGDAAPRDIIRATEASHLPFMSYFQLSAAELAEAINFKGSSQLAYDLLRQFPKLAVDCQAQPISPSLIRISAEITPEWDWNSKLHASSEQFLMILEDCDGEYIVHDQKVKITPAMAHNVLSFDFVVPVNDPMPPSMYLTVVSEKWLHSLWRAPVNMFDFRLPKEPHSLTEVLDVQSVPTTALKNQSLQDTFSFAYFNKFQSQCFHALMKTNENVFIGLARGSGKTTMAEMAIINAWRQNKQRIVYLQPCQELIDSLWRSWSKKYSPLTNPPKTVARLTGDMASDVRIVAQSHLVLATPQQFDAVSRRWRQRKAVQSLDLVIADDVHYVGNGVTGAVYENVLSRIRLMTAHIEAELRLVSLGNPLIYGRELAEWLGCSKRNVFNFSPKNRARSIQEIKIKPYSDVAVLQSLAIECARTITQNKEQKNLVFVSTKKRAFALLSSILEASDNSLVASLDDVTGLIERLEDHTLRRFIERGVGFYHETMSARDKLIVERLFDSKRIRVVIATKEANAYAPHAENVIVYGSQDDERIQSTDYGLNDILNMVGCCESGKVLAYVHGPKVAYYSEFLNEPMPVESNLHFHNHDVFLREIAAKTFQSKQDCIDWLTYTFFYRRVTQNPSFYGLTDVSHLGISEFLSELVETTVEDLEKAGLIEIEIEGGEDENEDENEEEEEEAEERIVPLNGAIIAAHYTVGFESMKKFRELTARSRLRNVIEAVTMAAEYEDLPQRYTDEAMLRRVAGKVPLKLAADTDFGSPHVKAFLLVQAHLSRLALPVELAHDQRVVLKTVLQLVHACVDTLSTEGYLNAMQAMDLSQMIVQGMWTRETPLRQLPHVDEGMLQRCRQYNVETVYDVMSLEDEERDDVLRLEGTALQDVAEFVNKYPNIDVRYELDAEKAVHVDEPVKVTVVIERDEEPEDLEVKSSRFPFPKSESWWVVIGDAATRSLYAIKKTQVAHETQAVDLELSLPTSGAHNLTIWCMCDSYIDADKEMALELTID